MFYGTIAKRAVYEHRLEVKYRKAFIRSNETNDLMRWHAHYRLCRLHRDALVLGKSWAWINRALLTVRDY